MKRYLSVYDELRKTEDVLTCLDILTVDAGGYVDTEILELEYQLLELLGELRDA